MDVARDWATSLLLLLLLLLLRGLAYSLCFHAVLGAVLFPVLGLGLQVFCMEWQAMNYYYCV